LRDATLRAIDAVDAGATLDIAALAHDVRATIAAADGSLVLVGGLRNAAAVADAVLAEQARRGERTGIAVVASTPGGRFAVENQLGAGAVVDALAARGLDHSSPEAAVACEGFRSLRSAVRHMLTSSGSGQALLDSGRRADVLAQSQLDSTDAVPVVRGALLERL
jgi:2-phosphosulfolactate phosphatase